MKNQNINCGPMLNLYPDSMGNHLTDAVAFFRDTELTHAFTSCYILPSLFHTDLDRGFSVIDYGLNEMLASEQDLEQLRELGIDLKLDFILNHASVLSRQFQDILEKGASSVYQDFFIQWNKFWDGYGTMTTEGYIQPNQKYIKEMFFRKPGLPLLMVRDPEGAEIPYWNTFYQEVNYPVLTVQQIMKKLQVQYEVAEQAAEIIHMEISGGKKPRELYSQETLSGSGRGSLTPEQISVIIEILESGRTYLGQMDLNIQSPLVWEFYDQTLRTLSEYGARIVRLDAFAYAPKSPGEKNFLNEPGTWELLDRVNHLAESYHLTLLPEIHAGYEEKIYEKIAQQGYLTYDFFLPGLVIDAVENHSAENLVQWANELQEKKIRVINMLGCHDGIPLLDLKGMIPEERIQQLIDVVVQRGGYVKDLHGQKNIYYQVNATYYSALGESDEKMLLARAIQLFMPGKPQVWYLDLFAGKNDHQAVARAGAGGHKEINRTNLSVSEINEKIQQPVVKKQLQMLRFRAECQAFGFDSTLNISSAGHKVKFQWSNGTQEAALEADLKTCQFLITGRQNGNETFRLQ